MIAIPHKYKRAFLNLGANLPRLKALNLCAVAAVIEQTLRCSHLRQHKEPEQTRLIATGLMSVHERQGLLCPDFSGGGRGRGLNLSAELLTLLSLNSVIVSTRCHK
jgi:hypothetical protein